MRSRILFLSVAAPLLAAGLMAASFPDPPKVSTPAAPGSKTAVLAGGCFWGMEAIYEHVKGVTSTQVGFSGGSASTAHYEKVSEGDTGHAESIKITYDPSKVTYGELLKIFFGAAHDPTTLNRQHYDVGTQYRSAIFYADDEQKTTAETYIKELNSAHVFKNSIVTQVVPLKGFYPAEEYHQHFMDRNPHQGYIVAVDIPLFNNFKEKFPEYYKP
jgi:peptide-methionine (S)-S-oxide reductase